MVFKFDSFLSVSSISPPLFRQIPVQKMSTLKEDKKKKKTILILMNVESKIKNGIVLYFVTNLVQKYIKNKLLLLRKKEFNFDSWP